jgi:SAM-dependent methyltransferase
MIDFILKNTEKCTLVEAGCGNGEVSLVISKLRGDNLILIDKSQNAIELAKKKQNELDVKNINVQYFQYNIEYLSQIAVESNEKIVFNIGVIEHFKDCSRIIKEMDLFSDIYSLVLVPEKSLFWRIYIYMAYLTGMVDPGFYVYLFRKKELTNIIQRCNMRILWVKTLRILWIIPYLCICYHKKSDDR